MKHLLKPLTALIFILCLIAIPDISQSACADAVNTCFTVLFPALFPFFVLSDIFVNSGGANILGKYLKFIMKPLFGISGNGAAAFILGMTSGYPVGAKVASSLWESGEISKNEAERLVYFCNNSGPMFIIGALGAGIFHSQKAGVFLYIIHILASATLGMILKSYGKSTSLCPKGGTTRKTQVFTSAVESSIGAIIRVFAYVIFFAVIMEIFSFMGVFDLISMGLGILGIHKSISVPLMKSLLEMTTGLKMLSVSDNTLSTKLIIASFSLGWSGLSIIFQSNSVTQKLNINLKKYILARLCHGVIAAIYTFAAIKILNFNEAVFLNAVSSATAYTSPYRPNVLLTYATGIAYIISWVRLKGTRPGLRQKRTATR